MYRDNFFTDLQNAGHETVGLIRKTNVRFFKGRKGISFSEPLPSLKIRENMKNAGRFVELAKNTNTRNDIKTNFCSNNEDLVAYLKRVEENMVYPSSFSLPNKKRNDEKSRNLENNYLSKTFAQTVPKNNRHKNELFPRFNTKYNTIDAENKNSILQYHGDVVGWDSGFRVRSRTPSSANSSFCYSPTLMPPPRIPNDSPLYPCNNNNSVINITSESISTINRGFSIDTGSGFSSETDSDFTFYPCRSRSSIPLESLVFDNPDLTSAAICQLPTQLEDPDSPLPPYRQDVLGNSLDDVTRQFYLEDDALSDDVFVDDYYSNMSHQNNTMTPYRSNSLQNWRTFENATTALNTKLETMGISDRQDSSRSATTNDNHVDKCVTNESILYNINNNKTGSFSRFEENSRSVTLVLEGNGVENIIQNKPRLVKMGVSESGMEITNTPPSSRNPNSNSNPNSNQRKHSESDTENYDLSEYNLNLANAFDSLRRNSMQSKSRKLWKERRTRMRRSTLFNIKGTTVFHHSENAVDGAMENDNDDVNERNRRDSSSSVGNRSKERKKSVNTTHNAINVKPLRGILKNKTAIFYPTISTSCPSTDNGSFKLCRRGDFSGTDNVDVPETACNVYSPKRNTDFFSNLDYGSCGYIVDGLNCGYLMSGKGGQSRRRITRDDVNTGGSGVGVGESFAYSPTYVSVGVQVNMSDL